MLVENKRLGEIKADYWLWKEGSCGDAMHRKARKLIEIDMFDLIADRAEMRAELADIRKQYDEARVLLSTRVEAVRLDEANAELAVHKRALEIAIVDGNRGYHTHMMHTGPTYVLQARDYLAKKEDK